MIISRNYYLYPELMTELNEEVKWDELMAAWRVFQGPVSSTCPAEYSQAAKQFYFGQTIEQDEVGSLVEMLTDVWLWWVVAMKVKKKCCKPAFILGGALK